MRAVIDATGYHKEMALLLYHTPTPLLGVGGKPILFHIVEFLIQQGVSQIDMVLNHLPHKIEESLGNGERWGIQINYHLAKDPLYPFQIIRPITHHLEKGLVIFGQGDCLPCMESALFSNTQQSASVFLYPDKTWAGWGVLPVDYLATLPKNMTEVALANLLKNDFNSIEAKPFLSAQTLQELKDSNIKFITQDHDQSLFPTTARCIEPGIWLSRGVSLHPTAKIIPPAYIGEFCQINKYAVVGPNAVIENECIIGSETVVEDSLIFQSSYIGEGLVINNSIVDRNLLINLSLMTHVTIIDEFILSGGYPRHLLRGPMRLLERLAGTLLFILLSPLYLLMRASFPLKKEKMLKLPAYSDPLLWETFDWETFDLGSGTNPSALYAACFRLPLLIGIAKGYIHFVGVVPRTIGNVQQLPPDWKKLYLRSKVGIITVSDLEESDLDDTDKCFASEVLYAVRKGFWYDLSLVRKWLARKWKKLFNYA